MVSMIRVQISYNPQSVAFGLSRFDSYLRHKQYFRPSTDHYYDGVILTSAMDNGVGSCGAKGVLVRSNVLRGYCDGSKHPRPVTEHRWQRSK